MSFVLLLHRLFLPYFMLVLISERAVHSSFESSFSRKLLDTDSFSEQHASRFDGRPGQGCIWNGGCILIREKCLSGMISNREFHPDLMETSGRDDFQRRNASLKARIANLRCMRARNIILEKAKSKFRIHRPGTQQKSQENRSKNKAKANSNRSKQQPCRVNTTWLLHIRFVSPL